MLRKLLATALLTAGLNAPAFGLTIAEAHRNLTPTALDAVSAGFGQSDFHWAHDSWIGNDKFFDHGSFAFVLGQISEDVLRPTTDAERGIIFTLNMVPWLVKEVIDGYSVEGASYKDFIWSGAGCALALIVH